MRRHARLLLSVICIALALLLATLWFDVRGNLRNVRWQPPEPREPDFAGMAPAVPAQRQANAADFAATLARPLFSPNRRPPPPPAAPPPPPPVAASPPAPDQLAKVQILGMYEGAHSGGIIARVDGKAKRARLNDRIGDWTIIAIEGRDVTFSRAGEKRVLSLVVKTPSASGGDPASSSTPAPAPAVAPAPAPEPLGARRQPTAEGAKPLLNPRDARR